LDRKYDPLHYVLLHPNGELGWSPEIKEEMPNANVMNYYAFWLAFCNEDYSILHWSGQLFQQYGVDQYVKIETERLLYFRQPIRFLCGPLLWCCGRLSKWCRNGK
jgi:hypothetical protein